MVDKMDGVGIAKIYFPRCHEAQKLFVVRSAAQYLQIIRIFEYSNIRIFKYSISLDFVIKRYLV